ncbi:ASKHA domain-containing protein [Candidatus Magnetominusculus dajiuhuensis]|uniref:ASKHA domain-containing protein n=1 Tax=Candidatus Magnetominusculus dajiuhuensis TaxID=3137712 RepID=UPI003B43200F
MNPLVWRFAVGLTPPSLIDNASDASRLKAALLQPRLHIPLTVLRGLPAYLRDNDYTVTGIIAADGGPPDIKIVSIGQQGSYGVALDIGSTNIWGELIDLDTGAVLCKEVITNPQTRYGADILTRIFYSMQEDGGAAALYECLVGAVNAVIKSLRGPIAQEAVHAVVVAANTTMTHFLLNLPVNNIPTSPYIPVVNAPGFQSPSNLGIEINPEGVIYLFPNAGSYVGGDIVSGIIASKIYKSDAPSILIDIGTNVEIAVGTKDWILVGAGAGGPAFDEGIAGIGGRAAGGAIYDVSLDAALNVNLQTIGGAPPSCLCGTGMVSLVASLFEAGIIEQNGALIEGKRNVVNSAQGSGFLLYEDGGGRQFIVYQTEINNFLLSKAAMFTLLSVMTHTVGLAFSDIDKFILTGALGTHIKAKDVKILGLLPDVSEDRIIHIENASLAGAGGLLRDRGLLDDIKVITNLITYKEMNEDTGFMNELQGAMFIPHTDVTRLKG